MAFVPVVGIVMALSFLFVFHAVAVVISIRFFQAWSVVKAKNMQGFQSILHQRAYSGQIDGNSEAIYGHIYSKQQVSYLSNSYREDVEQWLNRFLPSHYLAVYIDATFIANLRGKQISKEVYYNMSSTNGNYQNLECNNI